MIYIRTQNKENMNIQLIIILTLLALVIPLSIAMFYEGFKQATTSTKETEIETEISAIIYDRSEIINRVKQRIEQFRLTKDDAGIYIVEGKFDLYESEIDEILQSVK